MFVSSRVTSMISAVVPSDLLGIAEYIGNRVLHCLLLCLYIFKDFLDEEATALRVNIIDRIDAFRSECMVDV
jgi:hypothetical protein